MGNSTENIAARARAARNDLPAEEEAAAEARVVVAEALGKPQQ